MFDFWRAKISKWIVYGLSISVGILCESTQAQSLNFLRPGTGISGDQIDAQTPEGYSCNTRTGTPTVLSIGAGVAEPDVLPGSFGNFIEPIPSRVVSSSPVFGIAIHIPLGSKRKGCDEWLDIETAMLKVRAAVELFDSGLITQEELEKVGRESYGQLILNRP